MKHEVFVISPKKESVINENEQKENFSETRNMNSEFITMEFHKNMGEITNEITTQKSKRKAAKNHELSEENAVKIMKNNLTPESQLPVDTLTPSTPASLSNNFVDLSSLRSSQLDHNIPKKDYFSMLPDEVLLLIFKIFQHKPTLITCACVCRRWKEIAFDSDLWPRIELSQKKILPGIMLHILNRKPTVLRMSQTEISTPIFCNVEQIMENFVSKLEYLDLSMATILPADLELLLRTCRILLKLSLESCTVNYNICVEISKNPRLSVLNMSQCMGLDETGMKEILVNCKKLVELNIAWTKLSPAAIKCICQSLTKDILKLNFSGCFYAINDAYLSNLVIRCNKLKELDLSDSTGISDKSIQVICDNLNNLEVLSLSRCYNIYPSTYTKLFRLPSITHLNIFGLFIETQIETLRKTSHIKLNTMKFSYIARPTVGHRRTSIWNMQVRD